MKRIFLPILFLGLALGSCTKTPNHTPNVQTTKPSIDAIASYATPENVETLRLQFVAEWQWLGMKHNEGLETQRVKLSNMTPLEHLSKTTDIALVKTNAIDYLTEFPDVFQSTTLTEQQKVTIFNDNFNHHFDYVSPYTAIPTPTDIFVSNTIANASVSSELKSELTTLISTANINEDLSVEDFNNAITDLETYSLLHLDLENELDIFFATSSVARASHEYWATNKTAWMETFGTVTSGGTTPDNGKIATNKGAIKGMTAADMGGVVAGALGGVLAGGLPGIAMGALIGGTTASTAKVVENVWNHFFP